VRENLPHSLTGTLIQKDHTSTTPPPQAIALCRHRHRHRHRRALTHTHIFALSASLAPGAVEAYCTDVYVSHICACVEQKGFVYAHYALHTRCIILQDTSSAVAVVAFVAVVAVVAVVVVVCSCSQCSLARKCAGVPSLLFLHTCVPDG